MAKLSDFSIKTTLNCRGKLLSLADPLVMGIINITPDSFYDGGKNVFLNNALRTAAQMLEEGASILDIGGYSTRPGANDVTEEEEWNRVIPVIQAVAREFPEAVISIDTFRSRIAKEAIANGAAMVNDISGGDDDEQMFASIAELNVPYILMHKQGSIKNMQQNPQYADIVTDIMDLLLPKIKVLNELGVADIIIDPGFGFGKTITHNFELLNRLHEFHIFGLPVLAGLSRKSTIYRTLGIAPEQALNGTTVLNTVALLKGARILRVHDVKEATECIKLITKLNG